MDQEVETGSHPRASPTSICAPNGSDDKAGRLVLSSPDDKTTKLDGGGG